jgi:hypothetical protein
MGLPPHPVQVAEQARIAELKRTDPSLAQAQIAQASQKRSTIMPDQTREALKRLADSMLRASGVQATPVSAPSSEGGPPPMSPPAARDPKLVPPGKQSGKRADGFNAPKRIVP